MRSQFALFALFAGAVGYTECISADPTPTSVLVVRLQSWIFGEYEALFIAITLRSTLTQSDRVLSMGQIEIFNHSKMLSTKFSLQNQTYKQALGFDNPHGLILHKTQQNQILRSGCFFLNIRGNINYGIRIFHSFLNRKKSASSWISLVGFYGISTIVSYLMPNPLYTYILNIYDLVWFGFMAYQPLLVI